MKRTILLSLLLVALSLSSISCGSSSSSGGANENSATIEGTLSASSSMSKVLGAGDGGIPNVEVSALDDTDVTDAHGNFMLVVDGEAFPGGAVEFLLKGEGIDSRVTLDQVLGGPGGKAYVDFVLNASGQLTGQSSDETGKVLSSVGGGQTAEGCTTVRTFSEGPKGALWQPHPEGTGPVEVLMPANYRHARIRLLNVNDEIVAVVLRRNCCSHNGRDHTIFSHSAANLAGAGVPLTVRFVFRDGTVDCLTVPDPLQRYES